ncbi:hypothetical protein ACFQY5_21905 [Paeniroseomonas aquatica]|uniref:Uncharacterized protein n=1 Tax=Paeniroseomonas aquatica TaxID=373043 RepID=A0ABT8A207_9PROT|nr:hypothetical protein [Paeniroseomonas aquatica]MDN3563696.1 hypothetical protein [Paeniroseomonas aquatica]
MGEAISPAAGRRYGLALFCRVWEAARSSPYAAPSGASGRRHRRRGPRPALSDAALLAPMRADLAR